MGVGSCGWSMCTSAVIRPSLDKRIGNHSLLCSPSGIMVSPPLSSPTPLPRPHSCFSSRSSAAALCTGLSTSTTMVTGIGALCGKDRCCLLHPLIDSLHAVLLIPFLPKHHSLSRFPYFFINLYTSLTVVESLMMAIAAIVPHYLMGIAGV